MPIVIAAVVVAAVIVAFVLLSRRGSGSSAADATAPGVMAGEDERLRPSVEDFHVRSGIATVFFAVPLGEGAIDPVLADLLGREAVEVVREKRHTLPLGEVHSVVAMARRGAEWETAKKITLDTPGELPPPMHREPLARHHHDFDPFDRIADLPTHAPGLATEQRSETLGSADLTLPAVADAGLRAQGIDPAAAGGPAIVLGLMRASGESITETGPNTYRSVRGGQTTFVRVVPHEPGSHPELDESAIRKFVVDFGQSGAGRGLLITEKYSPFEIYDRERRDPRMRFITRERLQAFVDALFLG